MKEKGYYAESYVVSREWANETLMRVSELLNIPIIDMDTFKNLQKQVSVNCEDIYGNTWKLNRDIVGVGIKEYSYQSFGGMLIDGKFMKGKADLVVILPNIKIRLEFRYQDKPGTADEKHSYFLMQSELCSEFDHNILICEGSYIRKCRKHKAFEKLSESYPNTHIVLGFDNAIQLLKSLASKYVCLKSNSSAVLPVVSVQKHNSVNS